MRKFCFAFGLACAFLALSSSKTSLFADDGLAAKHEFFEKRVRPLLVERCGACHSGESKVIRGGLRVDSRAALLQGGETGPAIEPGDPDKSLLIDAVRYGDIYQMPPKSRLPAEEIAALEKWVADGALWPGDDGASANAPVAEFDWRTRKAEHWAWQPLRSAPHDAATVAGGATLWDARINARIAKAQLRPASRAEPRHLLRRLYFDLTGLPPDRDATRRFVRDSSELAWQATVDRLLASPAFGEHWARHWLDLVRYAESRGHEFDYDTPNAHEYRDYVIRALNEDVGYDQIVREHVAGDLLSEPRRNAVAGYNESILGGGFWHLGEWVHSPVDIRKDETDRYDNMLDVFSKTFLGLTVACARCHDHKFDAISQRDYYALMGYLQSSTYRQARFESLEHNERIARKLDSLRSSDLARIASERSKSLGRPAIAESLLAAAKSEAGKQPLAQRARQALAATSGDDVWRLWRVAVEHADKDGRLDPKRIADALKMHGDWAGVLFDFTREPPRPWMADGWAFGCGPLRPGDLVAGINPTEPIAEIAVWGGLRRDPSWPKMQRAPGVAGDSGRIAGMERAGQTVRTATFEITAPALHYLIQGEGQVQLVVDSHRMLHGPLHQGLVKGLKSADGKATWIRHPCDDYIGHRAHLEFSGPQPREFRIYAVTHGSEAPKTGLPSPAQLVAEHVLGEQPPLTLRDLARRYESLLHQAASWIERGEARDRALEPALLTAANWWNEHGHTWDAATNAEDSACVVSAEAHFEAAHQLIASIKTHSRTAPAMWDGAGENERLLIRGNHKTAGDVVPRGLPQALPPSAEPETGSGRLELAEAMLRDDNPLTARVMANRIWAKLMGRGVVASPDNFGVLGERPTHPELLDDLALEFRKTWSIKSLVRKIVLSDAYRRSSQASDEAASKDPANKLWARHPVKRLSAESIRDALIQIAGRTNSRMYGASVPVHLTPFMEGRGRPRKSGPVDGDGRRSVYISVRRNFLSPMMLAFDTPQPTATIGRRTSSNVPAQALILLNDPMATQQCERWAQRMLAETQNASRRDRIIWLFETAIARPPDARELELTLELIDAGLATADSEAARLHAWSELCHVLANLKEFIFLR